MAHPYKDILGTTADRIIMAIAPIKQIPGGLLANALKLKLITTPLFKPIYWSNSFSSKPVRDNKRDHPLARRWSLTRRAAMSVAFFV
jgi:hypothetical protein